MLMKEYGLRIFKGGFVLHSDGRRRAWTDDGVEEIPKRVGPLDATRGGVKAFSDPSRKRLELIAASAENEFRSMLTLTYHAKSEAWEDAPELNARVVRRSKRDLNRFLSSMRDCSARTSGSKSSRSAASCTITSCAKAKSRRHVSRSHGAGLPGNSMTRTRSGLRRRSNRFAVNWRHATTSAATWARHARSYYRPGSRLLADGGAAPEASGSRFSRMLS